MAPNPKDKYGMPMKKAGKSAISKSKPKDTISIDMESFKALVLCRHELQEIYKRFNNGVVNAITSPGLNADIDWTFIEDWQEELVGDIPLKKDKVVKENEFNINQIVKFIQMNNKDKVNVINYLERSEITSRYEKVLKSFGCYSANSDTSILCLISDADEFISDFMGDLEEMFIFDLMKSKGSYGYAWVNNITVSQLQEVFFAIKNLNISKF